MKIVIINGSNRKNGATALILNEMYQYLKEYKNVEVQFIHVADMKLKYCTGCGFCYKTGSCIYMDDIEELSLSIANADGIILGSPTYASNVSGQMKVIIDRGHFVIEQLLHGKYAISVATYENYGGRDTAKVLNKLLLYSGARVSGTIVSKNEFNSNPIENGKRKRIIYKKAKRLYKDIKGKRSHPLQDLIHLIVFYIGIRPFVMKKGGEYAGVINHWKRFS